MSTLKRLKYGSANEAMKGAGSAFTRHKLDAQITRAAVETLYFRFLHAGDNAWNRKAAQPQIRVVSGSAALPVRLAGRCRLARAGGWSAVGGLGRGGAAGRMHKVPLERQPQSVTISNTTAAAAPVSATNQTIEITNTQVSRVMSGAYAPKLTCTLRNGVLPRRITGMTTPEPHPYFGACNPGDESQSFMREAVSACRALRIRSSRTIPGGRVSASSLSRFASAANRSSKETACLTRRLCMASSRCSWKSGSKQVPRTLSVH